MDSDKVQESNSDIPINPNLRNARRRTKNRSGRMNIPRPKKEVSEHIEPLTHPVSFNDEISDTIQPGQVIVGNITINEQQIDIASTMFADIANVARDNLSTRINFPDVKDMASSLYHITVAAQLYSSLPVTHENTGSVYKFKSLNALNINVPTVLSNMIQHLGHFKVAEGIVRINHLPTIMLRQVSKALAKSNDSFDNHFNLINYEDSGSYYFDTPCFSELLNSKCNEILDLACSREFVDPNQQEAAQHGEQAQDVQIVELRIRLPRFDPDNRDVFINAVNHYVPIDERPSIIQAAQCVGMDFQTFDALTLEQRFSVGLKPCPVSVKGLHDSVGLYSSIYHSRYTNVFDTLFVTGPMPNTGCGTAAQTVKPGTGDKGYERSGQHDYSISKTESVFGLLNMLCESFEFRPKYDTHSAKHRRQLFNELSTSSIKK
jgi:hypothetical protein